MTFVPALAPLPSSRSTSSRRRAFRFMAQARHAGKVIVRNGQRSMPAIRQDGTYLITGDWLASGWWSPGGSPNAAPASWCSSAAAA